MFLDASSIIAMLGSEAEGDAFADALSAAPIRLTSPIAVWETVAGLVSSIQQNFKQQGLAPARK